MKYLKDGTPTEVEMELYFPNGSPVTFEGDVVEAIAYMYGKDMAKAREEYRSGVYSKDEIQKAINYWIEKTDGPFSEEETFGKKVQLITEGILKGADINKSISRR